MATWLWVLTKARQGQHALAVDDFIVVGKNRIFGKARDLRAVDGDILMFRDVVVPVEGDVLNQFFSSVSLSS